MLYHMNIVVDRCEGNNIGDLFAIVGSCFVMLCYISTVVVVMYASENREMCYHFYAIHGWISWISRCCSLI